MFGIFHPKKSAPKDTRQKLVPWKPCLEALEHRIVLSDVLPNTVLQRSLMSSSDFSDTSTSIGGWDRIDQFTNITNNDIITIDDVQALLLNPQDVGFNDIYGDPGGT